MCIYCDLWGDGMIWYLNPKNYPRHMYTLPKQDTGKPKKLTGEMDTGSYINLEKSIVDAMELGPDEFAARIRTYKEGVSRSQGVDVGYIGQVVPLREMEQAVELANPRALIGCICRKQMLGLEEQGKSGMTCMGIGVGMLKWERFPERYKHGVHFLSVEESKNWLREMDKRGFVHTFMIFGNRFIGGICNCDYPACDAIMWRLDFGVNLLKGHYVAVVDYDLCNGCGTCVARCQFGAIKMNVTIDKTNIDQMRCFGCGLCETTCPQEAISLLDRTKIPALSEVW